MQTLSMFPVETVGLLFASFCVTVYFVNEFLKAQRREIRWHVCRHSRATILPDDEEEEEKPAEPKKEKIVPAADIAELAEVMEIDRSKSSEERKENEKQEQENQNQKNPE